MIETNVVYYTYIIAYHGDHLLPIAEFSGLSLFSASMDRPGQPEGHDGDTIQHRRGDQQPTRRTHHSSRRHSSRPTKKPSPHPGAKATNLRGTTPIRRQSNAAALVPR